MERRAAWGAIVALIGVTTFVAVVVSLHFLQPGYDPKHQLMSELALGAHGWAMLLAFGGLAAAAFGVQLAVGALGAAWGLRILLIAASLFFLAAGVFPLGDTSDIHIAAIAIAFVLAVLAMYLYPGAAGQASAAAPRSVSWTLAVFLAASVALGHSLVPMGIGQRMAALALIAWLTVLGVRLLAFLSRSPH